MDYDWHDFVSSEGFLCVLQSESSAGCCTHPPAHRRGKPQSLRWRRHHANHHTMWRHHESNRHKTLGWRHPNWSLSGSEQRWHRKWRHACSLFVDLSCSCGRIGENNRLSGDSFVCPETVHGISGDISFSFVCLLTTLFVCLFSLFFHTVYLFVFFLCLHSSYLFVFLSFFVFLSTLSFVFFHSFGLLSSFYLSFVSSCFSG